MEKEITQRPIRFRAWDKLDKKMVYGLDLTNGDMGYYPRLKEGIIDLCPQHIGVEPAIIMQYTGLKDRNGKKEIYEGDIVKDKYKGVVKFGNGTFDNGIYKFTGFYIENLTGIQFEDFWQLTGNEWNLNGYKMTHTEVIGNIYENPELLIEKGGRND